MTIHLVSVSGGKDSTATLLVALATHGHESVRAVFADTGNEHEATYDYVRYLESATGVSIKWIKQDFTEWWWHRREYVATKWALPHRDWPTGVPAEIVARVLKVFDAGPTGNPYLDLCVIKGRFPSRKAQFCTQYLKTEPLTEYALELIEEYGAVESWQGVRADESEARRWLPQYEYRGGAYGVYRPILRWNVADVFEAHTAAGIKPNPLYSQGMNRVGCMPCVNASKDEILAISKRFPGHIERVAMWEDMVSLTSKRSNATFFPAPGANDTARERGNIWQVVLWSQTQRGSKTPDWIRQMEEPALCASSYGLCE